MIKHLSKFIWLINNPSVTFIVIILEASANKPSKNVYRDAGSR